MSGMPCSSCSHQRGCARRGCGGLPQPFVLPCLLCCPQETEPWPRSTSTASTSPSCLALPTLDCTGESQMDGSTWGTDTSGNSLTKREYMMLHQRCAVCHWPLERRGRWLELHHIIGGAGRKDLPDGSNWLALCNRCHHAVHDRLPHYGELPKGAVITAKQEEDGPVDLSQLAALRRRKALPYDPCPIPEKFLNDRSRRGGEPWP